MYLPPRIPIVNRKYVAEKSKIQINKKNIVFIFSGLSPISIKILAGMAMKIVKMNIIKKSRFMLHLGCYLYGFEFQSYGQYVSLPPCLQH